MNQADINALPPAEQEQFYRYAQTTLRRKALKRMATAQTQEELGVDKDELRTD